MKTVSIMNNKGGVGKTVTAINLADILQRAGKRVVLVDCDGQANLTRFYTPDFDAAVNCSTADVLCGYGETVWSDNLLPIKPDLSILPGSSVLYELDLMRIKDNDESPRSFHDFCSAAAEDGTCDYMIFDCPPGFTAASVAALEASDYVVIPSTMDGFSFSGLLDMQMQIANLRRAFAKTKIAGVLITQWRNTKAVKDAEHLMRSLNVHVFKQTIRRTEKVTESTLDRTPIVEYSPGSAAAKDYQFWVAELLEVIGG